MSQKHDHKHDHKHVDSNPKHESGWKPHTDWRVLGAVVMLLAIVIYILTLDESIQPPGTKTPPPAATPK